MIEMHLDPTPAIDHFSFDSIGVLANQKAGEAGDGLVIGEKGVFGRPPAGKFHQLAIVANVHIEIEFVKTDFGLGLSFHETQAGGGLDKLIEGGRRAHDHVPARSPKPPWVSMNSKIFCEPSTPGVNSRNWRLVMPIRKSRFRTTTRTVEMAKRRRKERLDLVGHVAV